MDAPFTAKILSQSQVLLDAQLRHPFVVGLGDGSLTTPRFQRWLVQEWKRKEAYARTLAWAAALTPDRETMAYYARLLTFTLDEEMLRHAEYACQFGISQATLDDTPLLPTTRALTEFLLTVAEQGELVDILASHLPIAWDLHEIAASLVSRFGGGGGPYDAWIRQYADPAFGIAARGLRDDLDRYAGRLSVTRQKRVGDVYVSSRRFQVRFWEMCWTGENWIGQKTAG